MTECFEAIFGTLSLMSVALSVYLWRRAATVPVLRYQPSVSRAWRCRLQAKAGSAAGFALCFQSLLIICEVIEFITGR
jgi:hypothetical protein